MKYFILILLFCINVLAQETGPADSVMRTPAAGGKARMGSIDLSKTAAVGASVLTTTNGGTGVTGFTSGSVIFSDGSVLTENNADFKWDDVAHVLDIVGTLNQTSTLANDTGGSGGLFSVTSHTTVNGSVTTIGINGVAAGTVDVGAENDKTVSGMNFVVTRGDGTDDGILDNLTGTSTLVFANSGAAGVTGEGLGYDHTYFGQQGVTTNYYSFRGQTVPAGSGTLVNYTGLYLNNQLDNTLYKGLTLVNSGTISQDYYAINSSNNHSVANNFFITSMINSGNIGGGLTGYNFNNSGNVTGNAVGLEYNNSGTVGGNAYGLHIDNQASASITGDYQPIILGNSATVGGNLLGLSLNNSGVVAADSKGIQVNETAASGGFLGLYIGKQANTTDPGKNMDGAEIFLNGTSAGSISGLQIDLQSSVATQNLEGLRINMQNATAGNSSVSISTDGGKLGINSKDVLLPAASFQSTNSIGTQMTTSADVTNTAYISNFLLSVFNINDNIAADAAGIGTNQVGFVGSVNVANGKTVAELNGVVSGWSQSGGAGTITDSSSYLAVGNLGGAAVTVDNQYGFRVKNGFNSGATNTWGVSIEDATTKNYFAGETDFGTEIALQNSGFKVNILPPTLAASYSLTLPVDDGTNGQVLATDGSGVLSWFTLNTGGDVSSNTATSVDSEIALFSSTTGKLIKRATGTGVAHVTSGVLSASNVVLTSEVTGVLPVANGGTNSSTSLNNNRVMKSSGGSIVEAAVIAAARALISDANGIPTQSVTTSTELSYLSGVTSPTGSGALVLGTAPTLSNPIVGTQATSDSSTKAASTAYVTTAVANAVAGVNPAVAVQAATTSAGNTSGLTYNNGVSGIGATLTGVANTALTVDGYTFTAVGQRLLVKNDTQSPSGAFNGVYYVTQIQTAILPIVLTRTLDFDTPSDINNTGSIPVINGTANGTTSWVLSTAVATVGTDPLTFTEFTRNPADYLLKANNLSDVSSANTAMNNISPLTTKGDLIAFSTVNARLPAGANGTLLTADSTQTLGLKYTTATYPATSGTSGTILRSNGTNIVNSTATYPGTAGTSGTLLTSDGTNIVNTTATYPSTAGTTGKLLISDGTNIVSSTPTYPNASATSGKNIQSDGTNFVASSSTWPTTVTAPAVVVANTNNTFTALAATTSNRVLLTTNGTSLSMGQVDLTSQVTGAAPIANGGTGQTTKTAAFDALSPNASKGDIAVYTGSSNTSLPVGSNGTVLTADSTQTRGVAWVSSITSNDSPNYRFEGARVVNNGSSCSVTQSGTWITSPTRNGTGDCTLTLGFAASPFCTVTVVNGADAAQRTVKINSLSSSSVRVMTFNSTGTITDLDFIITCLGAR